MDTENRAVRMLETAEKQCSSASRRASSVRIAYFSGTGGTARAALALAGALRARGAEVSLRELTRQERNFPEEDGLPALTVIVYPVYAFNAPRPVSDYIEGLQFVNGAKAAVISVSGGGEVATNKACRLGSIRRLQKKGYRVIYERMLVMPSNCIAPTPNSLSARLLRVLPERAEAVAEALFSGTERRTRPGVFDRLASAIAAPANTKMGAGLFGKGLQAGDGCTGCGLCAERCPQRNIAMRDLRPLFGADCALCLRCVYGCPKRAIRPRFGGFLVLEQGYSLESIEQAGAAEVPAGEERRRERLFSGVYKYLSENW